MFGFFENGLGAAECRLGVDEVGGVERGAAGLALVAIGVFVAAMWAGAGDVAVGEELMGFLIVVLHRSLLDKLACFIELVEIFGSGFVVFFAAGAAVDVERDAEFGERLFDYLMVTVDDVLWRDAFFAGLDGDRHTVFVAAANEHNFLSLCTQVAHIDVGGYIYTGKMADMDGAVGIG